MSLFNFGREQLENGTLNNMLEQVGIDDVGSFVNQFRNQATHGATGAADESADFAAMGGSMLNQFSGEKGGNNSGNNSGNMIQGAMNAYKMFSGGQGGGGRGDGFLDNISSTYQNTQKMYAMYKQFDKNGDGKITAEDIEIYLKEIGLGGVSPFLAKSLFQAVDQNHNGTLDFTDLMALTTMINKLSNQYGGYSQQH